MRRLIVNADDLGMTVGINRAIAEGCENGIITSATLMATANAFGDAVERASRLRPDKLACSVGCHVVLLDGDPLLPGERVGSLLESRPNGSKSHFRFSLADFAWSALSGKLNPDEIEAEASAQMERIQGAGLHPSHFDCHKHAHMFPAVFRPLLRAAKARGIRAVRNPFGQFWTLPSRHFFGSPKLWRRFAELSVLRRFASEFRQEVGKAGLRTPDGTMGVLVTGELDLSLFTGMIESLPEGTWEFVCHPGYNDADLSRVRTRLRQSREKELGVLTSPEAKSALLRRGIELISYHDL